MTHRILMPIFRPRMGIMAEALHQGEYFFQWHVRGYSSVLTNRNKTESTIVSPKIDSEFFTWYMFLVYRTDGTSQKVCLKVWGKSKKGCITYKERHVMDFKLAIRRRKRRTLLVRTGRVEFFGEHQTLTTVKLPSKKIVKRNRPYDHDKLYVSMRLIIKRACDMGQGIDELINGAQEPEATNFVNGENADPMEFAGTAQGSEADDSVDRDSSEMTTDSADSEDIEVIDLVSNDQEPVWSDSVDEESSNISASIWGIYEINGERTQLCDVLQTEKESAANNCADGESAELMNLNNSDTL